MQIPQTLQVLCYLHQRHELGDVVGPQNELGQRVSTGRAGVGRPHDVLDLLQVAEIWRGEDDRLQIVHHLVREAIVCK